MKLFGEKKDPRAKVRELQTQLRREQRKLDREIAGIQQKSKQSEIEVKKYAKENNMAAAKILARQIYASRKAVNRLYSAKAEMNSVVMGLDHQVAVVKMSGAMEKSTQVMKSMSNLVRVPEIQENMRDLSKQMMKMGIVEEMINDSMESTFDQSEDVEDEIQAEIDKILLDVTKSTMGKVPDALTDTLPTGFTPQREIGSTIGGDDDEDLDEMRARLDALRN